MQAFQESEASDAQLQLESAGEGDQFMAVKPWLGEVLHFGLVKVYRYPCLKKGAQGVIGKGHSSHVTNVRFTPNDQYLISTGGDDQCVMQWKVENKLS
jgi:WD40 repeat protein